MLTVIFNCIGPLMSFHLWNPYLASTHPVQGCRLILVSIRFSEAGFSVVVDDYMYPEVWIDQLFAFPVTCRLWFLGGMACQLAPEGFNLPQYLADFIFHCHHG